MLNLLNIHFGILGNEGQNMWAAQEICILSEPLGAESWVLVRTGVPHIPSTHTHTK